jgi:SPP1 gp7 family putative phage head morphogenesis protein
MGVYDDVGQFWAKTLGIEFDIRNLEGELALQEYTLIFSDFITDTSNNEVKALIQQAFEEGWSIDTMSNHLDMLFEQWTKGTLTPEDFYWMQQRTPLWRRELIVRTETTRAANKGAVTLYDTWGVERKEWLSTMDDRTRDTHKNVNGQIVNIDKPFILSNGIEIMQPGDTNAPLSETAACRCTILPVIPKGGLKGV